MVESRGNLWWTVCERKLVSTRIEYGGWRAVLCWKNMPLGAWGLEKGLLVSLGGSVVYTKYSH